jgi:hypothetical protein
MVPFQTAQAALQKATERGSHSTILTPLIWSLPVLVSGIIASVHEKASLWVTVFLAILTSVTVLTYIGTYIYCLLHGKEALLRSETHLIQERLIEKGFFGDSSVGTFPRIVATSKMDQSATEADK